jgi:glycosyltransferase involved in cell wall biosynthesis
MKVGFDSRTLMVRGGSRTYAYNLINEINNNHKDIDITLFGGEEIHNHIPINPFPQKEYLRVVWENVSILPYMKTKKLDIFHGLKNVAPYYNCANTKTVITVHDITPLLFPSMLPLKSQMYWNLIKFNIKKADKIIAVSNTTKNDLVKKLNIIESKISVIYHGISEEFKPLPIIKKEKNKHISRFRLNVPDNSFIVIAVSTIHPRKNYINLLKAFAILKKKLGKPIHLLIVGKVDDKNYGLKINHLISANNLSSNVHLLGYVHDDDLPILYNLADLFVYPSLYEGFGLPILEAQACGCPVITSNVSSMPEVAGDGAILVDPYSVEEMANAISEVISNEESRDSLTEKGLKNCNTYSWEKCAEETVRVFGEVCNEG